MITMCYTISTKALNHPSAGTKHAYNFCIINSLYSNMFCLAAGGSLYFHPMNGSWGLFGHFHSMPLSITVMVVPTLTLIPCSGSTIDNYDFMAAEITLCVSPLGGNLCVALCIIYRLLIIINGMLVWLDY